MKRFVDGFLDGKAGIIQIARAETNEEKWHLISSPFVSLGKLASQGLHNLIANNSVPTVAFVTKSVSQGAVDFVTNPNDENVKFEDNVLGLRRALNSKDPYDWGRFAFNVSDIALIPFIERRVQHANRQLSGLHQGGNQTAAIENVLTREQIVQELLEKPVVKTCAEDIKNLFSNGNLGHQAYTLYKDGEVITLIEQVNKLNGDIVSRTQLNSPSIAFVLHDFDHAITTSMVDPRGEQVNSVLANSRDLWKSQFGEPVLSNPVAVTEADYKSLKRSKMRLQSTNKKMSDQDLVGLQSSNWPQILENRMSDSGQIRSTYNRELINKGLLNETQAISDGGASLNKLEGKNIQSIFGFGYLDNFDQITWKEFVDFWDEVNPQYWESLASNSSVDIKY